MMKSIYEILGIILFSAFLVLFNGINFGALFIISTLLIIYISVVINRIAKNKNNNFIKVFSKVINILVILFIASFLIIQSIIVIDMVNSKEPKDIEKLDYIVVLGAGLDGNKVGKVLKSRLDKALEYYNLNKNSIFIVSGGQGEDEIISEAEAMYNYLIENGVDSEQIIKEDKATTTLENIKFIKEILLERNDEDKKVLIVTNDFHLFRAKTITNILNIDNEGLASNTHIKVRINYLLREYPTMIIDMIRTIHHASISQ